MRRLPLTTRQLAALCLAVLACACESKRQQGDTEEPVATATPRAVVTPCTLDPARAGPMRRGGRLRAEISGDRLNLSISDAPAICGPMFNADTPAMGIRAGDGVYFEGCSPEGSVHIGSFERHAGAQLLHSEREQAGVEVTFSRPGKGSYTLRGAEGNRVTFSEDFMKADAEVELHEVSSGAKLRASLHFDCSQQAR